MKRIILIAILVLLLCGCNSAKTDEPIENSKPISKEDVQEEIPAFKAEEKEILPLPERRGFADSAELVDSLIANYEVLQFNELDNEFVASDVTMEKCDEGYLFTGIAVKEYIPFSNTLKKQITEYFDTPNNNYAVLIRFKSEEMNELRLGFYSKYGHLRYGFYKGNPAVDFYGDVGDPMYKDSWNNYFYESGEWAYVFLSATDAGKRACYTWSEDDVNDYNFQIKYTDKESYSVGLREDNSMNFYIELGDKGETAIISDIWLYSYKEAKR